MQAALHFPWRVPLDLLCYVYHTIVMNLKRATQKKHSGRAEFIAKFCLMQFSSSGESKCSVVATELQWCLCRQSSVAAASPCVHLAPTDLPQLRLWLIFWVRMNKDSSLEDRYYFYSLALKWAWVSGIKHSEESFVPVAILCLAIHWEMQTVLLREGGSEHSLRLWISSVCTPASPTAVNDHRKYVFWKV